MYKYKIIGRSNIRTYLTKYLIDDENFMESTDDSPDIIFLVGTKENSSDFNIEDYPNSKIIDVSSYKRLSASTKYVDTGTDIVYGIPNITKDYQNYRYVSNPGCSAIGSIMSLDPIIEYLEKDIILDVKFSKSSLTRKSSFNDKKDILTTIHPFKHSHQKEVNHFFGNKYNIKMIPSIIDVPKGVSINIHAFKKDKNDNLLNELYEYYRDIENVTILSDRLPELKDVLYTNKIFIGIAEDEDNILINVVLDNLTVGGAYTAYMNGREILNVE